MGVSDRHSQGVCYFLHRKAGIVPQSYQVRSDWIRYGQRIESGVNGEQFGGILRRDEQSGLMEIDFPPVSSSLERHVSTCTLDQELPHRFRCSTEEMPTVLPLVCQFSFHETNVGFVDESRGLQSMIFSFFRQFLGSEAAEFLIDQQQQFLRSGRIAVFDLAQQSRHIGHV
jgi:hypothetical protein